MKYDITKGDRRAIRTLFLAEGLSESGFLNRRLETIGADREAVGVYCFQGINGLAEHTQAVVNIVDMALGNVELLAGMGMLADSETDANGRIESAIGFFKALGFPRCAKDILASGRYQLGVRRIAVSLSPSNSSNGRIEDLILKEIEQSVEHACISSMEKCIKDATEVSLDSKAVAQIYVSCRKPGLCGVGRAFEAGILDATHNAYATHSAMVDFVLGA